MEEKKPQGCGPGGAMGERTPYEPPVCRVYEGGMPAAAGENTKSGCREERPPEVDINIGICPYFKKDRGQGRISCEGATFRFPDTLTRREYVYRFCAHPEGYKACPLKQAMDHYYERKYAHE